MKFESPTKIQAQTIPAVLEGHDLIASAQTGSGKTAAFGIPAAASILNNTASRVLVLAPTRELVGQIADVFSDLLLRKSNFKPAILIGGVSAFPQRRDIERHPPIIIATPGRLVDHLERYPDMLSDISMLVLDEADRMLEMGFAPQLKIIRKALPKSRQTLLFSATFPSDISELAEEWLKDPKRIAVDSTVQPVSAIDQQVRKVPEDKKLEELLKEISKHEGLALVFARTKRRADKLTNSLRDKDVSVCQIHGGRSQRQREVALQGLRKGKFKVMIATDIAARGIDVPEIRLVVNYDLPFVAEDYLHRIGRTARAGKGGTALCLVSPSEESLWRSIERLMARKEGRTSQEQRDDAQKFQKERKSLDRSERPQVRGRFKRGRSQDRRQETRGRDNSFSRKDDNSFGNREPRSEDSQGRGRFQKGRGSDRRQDSRGRDFSFSRNNKDTFGNREPRKEGNTFKRFDNDRSQRFDRRDKGNSFARYERGAFQKSDKKGQDYSHKKGERSSTGNSLQKSDRIDNSRGNSRSDRFPSKAKFGKGNFKKRRRG